MKNRKKYLVIGLLLLILLTFFSENNSGVRVQETISEKGHYINEIDGYGYKVPEGYFIDEEFLPYAVRFLSKHCIIEIYTEYCPGKEMLSYVNYTNRAIISNEVDFFDVQQTKKENITILSWNRKKLSKIENDKNYYLKIDVPYHTKVYTILIKSTYKINDYQKYLSAFTIIKSVNGKETVHNIKYASDREFNAETRAFYDQYFKNSSKVEWGIYQYDYMESDELYKIENQINHKFKLLLLYTEFNEVYDSTQVRGFLDKAYSENRVVELTLQPKKSHQQGNDLFRVLDGYYDEFLHNYAKDIADFNHPVLFRFANEMNGDWCEYSGYHMSLDTELYREMYRYIYDIFQEHNAKNIIWIWNPNGKSFPDFKWNAEAMYYPGNDYVDVLGLTLYNTGNFYKGEEWTEFYDLYAPLYEEAMKNYDMPFMITEFSCARRGGNKEEWTKKMLSEIEMFPNIKFAVWWNGADFTTDGKLARAYYINDSEEMCSTFRNYFEKNNR